MKPHYLRALSLYDAANRPGDVRVYDGEGNLKRVIKFTTLLQRPEFVYPVHRPGYRPSKRKVSSRRRKLRGIATL